MGLDIFYNWIFNSMANFSRYLILLFSLLFSNISFADCAPGSTYYPELKECVVDTPPTPQEECESQGNYWYGGVCNNEPEPEPTSEECSENGQVLSGGQCSDDCANGEARIDNLCLPSQNTNDCDSSSSDYQGTINGTAVCSGQSNCGENETYGQIATDDTNAMVCIPDDYGPPDCEIGTAQLTDYGFVCASSKDTPEEPEEPKLPTDAPDKNNDGVVDEQEIQDHEKDLKEESRNERIEREKREKEALKQDKKQTDKIGNVEKGIGELNGQVKGISEKLDNIGGDVDTSRLGSSFEFGVTTARLTTVTLDNPKISRFMSIPTIATSSTCPVYTIPSTVYWDAMPVSIHCDVFANNAGMLSTIFMAVWSFVAVRVFLSS